MAKIPKIPIAITGRAQSVCVWLDEYTHVCWCRLPIGILHAVVGRLQVLDESATAESKPRQTWKQDEEDRSHGHHQQEESDIGVACEESDTQLVNSQESKDHDQEDHVGEVRRLDLPNCISSSLFQSNVPTHPRSLERHYVTWLGRYRWLSRFVVVLGDRLKHRWNSMDVDRFVSYQSLPTKDAHLLLDDDAGVDRGRVFAKRRTSATPPRR